MDDGGGEVQAFYENELQKRFAIYEHMAQDPGGGNKADARKPDDA